MARFLQVERASFHFATLKDVVEDPGRFGAPFQTVLIINCYHYLFWGSLLSPERFSDHDEILGGLARITTDSVIFSNPLVLGDCPESTREIAAREPDRAAEYTPERFNAAARHYFDIEEHGRITKRRPLRVLRVRNHQRPETAKVGAASREE